VSLLRRQEVGSAFAAARRWGPPSSPPGGRGHLDQGGGGAGVMEIEKRRWGEGERGRVRV
jgi:hypothetical protein